VRTFSVGRDEELEEGQVRQVDAGGVDIGLVKWAGEIFAFHNRCPHQGGPLCAGYVRAHLEATADVGEIDAKRDRPVIGCPWHGWEFDIKTGRAVWEEGYAVKTYPTTISDGVIHIELRRGN
jgi:nitrite reductase/ring-hydroxylating ferredoxin subunit